MIPKDATGYFLSQKYDGARSFVTESGHLLSRNGHPFKAPGWFTEGLPKGIRLDCELYSDLGFDHLVSEIQKRKSQWDGITLKIIDIAVLNVPIEARIAALSRLVLPPHAQAIQHRPCLGNDDLSRTEAAVVASGGEGLCLRAPLSYYRPFGFIKIKTIHPDLNRNHLD
jgi:hypothetical protein